MTAAEILADLHRHGVELWAESDRLRYRGPALSERQRQSLKAHKDCVLASLAAREAHRDRLECACTGTAATPDALWAALSDDDHADLDDGYTPDACLQHLARRIAETPTCR